MKRIISVILAVLMIVTAFPLSAFANQDEETSTITQQEISYDSTNVLGSVVADAMNESESDKNNGYFIQNVTVTGLQASATLSAPDDTTLVIAVYDEKSGVMSTSGKTAVDSTSETVTVELAQCDMPEFFKIKAFLLNNENEPVCQNYENVEYTEAYQEFLAKTVFDFDEEKVINLDYGYESNFAVLSDDTDIIAQSENENILITNDEENGIYVFENANEEITSLNENDVFYFVYGDGAEDYILTKVGSIKNNDGTVTITTADEFEISEFFSYIKIDSSKVETDDPATFAMARGFDDNKGDEESETKRYEFDMFSITFKSGDKPDPDKTVVADTDVDYDITLTLKTGYMENYLKFYYDVELFGEDAYQFEYKNTTHIAFDLKIDAYGIIGVTFYAFKDAPIPILPALDLVGTIKLSITFSLHVSATGTIGFISSDGVLRHYDKQNNIDIEQSLKEPITPIIEFNGKVDITINVTPAASIGFKICKVVTAKIELSAKIDITLTLIDAVVNGDEISINGTEATNDNYHGCELCFDVTVNATPIITIQVSFNLTRDEKKEKLIVDINFPFVAVAPTYDYHLSLDEGNWTFDKGKCKNYVYKVTFTVVDENNKPLEGVKLTVGSETLKTDSKGKAVNYYFSGAYSCKAELADYEINKELMYTDPVVFSVFDDTAKITIHMKNAVTPNFSAFEDMLDACFYWDTTTINDFSKLSSDTILENYITNPGVPFGVYAFFSKNGINYAGGTGYHYEEYADPKGKFFLSYELDADLADWILQNVFNVAPDRQYSGDRVYYYDDKVYVSPTDLGGGVSFAYKVRDYELLDNNYYKLIVSYSLDFGDNNYEYVGDLEFEAIPKIKEGFGNYWSIKSCKELKDDIIDSGNCGADGDNLTWKLHDNGELVISGYGKMYDWDYDGDPVPWYSYAESIKKVTINDGATSIGDWTFAFCESLTSIIIPDSVTSIGERAFYQCNSLSSITLPSSITKIGNIAFASCNSLTSITIPDRVTSIGEWSFYCCYSLIIITIPDSVTSIGDYAFYGCDVLKTVYYTGTKKSWNNISIDNANDPLKKATKIYDYVAPQTYMLSAERTPVGLGVGDFSETVTSAVIGNEYVILVVRDKNAADLLAAENLLFIDQKTADSETLTFSFSLKDGISDYDVLFTTNDNDDEKDDEKENVVTGDVNGDGKLTASDARAALRMSAKLETYTPGQFAAADVNGDGKLTASDARIILRVSAKLQTF